MQNQYPEARLHVALPDDPSEALAAIAAYLSAGHHRQYRIVRVPDDGPACAREVVGHWQTPDWLDGLEDIERECRRVVLAARENRCLWRRFEVRAAAVLLVGLILSGLAAFAYWMTK